MNRRLRMMIRRKSITHPSLHVMRLWLLLCGYRTRSMAIQREGNWIEFNEIPNASGRLIDETMLLAYYKMMVMKLPTQELPYIGLSYLLTCTLRRGRCRPSEQIMLKKQLQRSFTDLALGLSFTVTGYFPILLCYKIWFRAWTPIRFRVTNNYLNFF